MDPDARITLSGSSTIALALLLLNLWIQNLELVLTAAGTFAAAFVVAIALEADARAA